jgi:ribosome-associated heat shock protein Hsp15
MVSLPRQRLNEPIRSGHAADSAVTRKPPETDSDAARRTALEPVRLDKWLWAARFFKTRSLAVKAVDGGRVRVNGEGAKPSRDIKRGDELAIRVGELEWVVEVKALSRQRGPAAQAALLYAEREDSRARRQAALALRKVQPHPAAGVKGRPTKKDRRLIHRFTGN